MKCLYRAVLLWLYVAIAGSVSTEGPLEVTFAEVNTSVTLYCNMSSAGEKRTWFMGYMNEDLYRQADPWIFENRFFGQESDGTVNRLSRVSTRQDVIVDNTNFAMTFNAVETTDVSFYTCVTESTTLKFNIVSLNVHRRRPGRSISHVKEGSTVKIPCRDTASNTERMWYQDWVFGNTTIPFLARQDTGGQVTLGYNPGGAQVYVDPSDFSLSITNVNLIDHGYFTCVTMHTTKKPSYDTVILNVYSQVDVREVAEFSTVTLQSHRVGFWHSHWNHGIRGVLYFGEGAIIGFRNRSDMAISEATFDLTIGTIRLEDDTFLTSVTNKDPQDLNVFTRLKVYIHPIIIGLENTEFAPGQNKTMKCRIDRVYPRLADNGFQMKWLGTTKDATPTRNSDGSMGYSIQMSKVLQSEDHGKEVICSVNPQVGQPAVRKESLREIGRTSPMPTSASASSSSPLSSSSSSSSSSLSKSSSQTAGPPSFRPPTTTRPNSQSETTRRSPNNIPSSSDKTALPMEIIIGVAAGGAVLLIILIIIIAVCCCCRKGKSSTKAEGETGQGSQSQYVNRAFYDNDSQKLDIDDKEPRATQNGSAGYE